MESTHGGGKLIFFVSFGKAYQKFRINTHKTTKKKKSKKERNVCKVHCGSAAQLRLVSGPGFYIPLHYCAPLVCVPDVPGGLAVWQENKSKTKKHSFRIGRVACVMATHEPPTHHVTSHTYTVMGR